MKSLSVAVLFALLLLAVIDPVAAQNATEPAPFAPPPTFDPPDPWPTRAVLPFSRSGGFYFSIVKITLLAVSILLWTRFADFLNRDMAQFRQNHALWNPIVVGSFVAAFILFWLIPYFWPAWLLLLIAAFAPGCVYAYRRNPAFSRGESILTPEHVRRVIASLGVKVATEKPTAAELGPAIKFIPPAGDEQKNQANLIQARQNPAFVPLKELIADQVAKRADLVMLDYTAQGVGVRYQIDGVWHSQPGRTREEADPLLAILKKIAGLNEQDRRSRQEAKFDLEYQGIKYAVKLTSQGVETGERAVIALSNPKKQFKTLLELGMREKLLEPWKEQCREQTGMILLSAPPSGGFSSLYTVALRECDRYLRDFVAIEDVNKPEPEVENIPVNKFNPKSGESALTLLPDILLKYPNVLVMSELADNATATAMLEQPGEGRFVFAGVKAKECAEALLRVLILKVPAADLAQQVKAVINVRLVRKLCDKCREAYAPAPELLKKLGLPPQQVPQLYRPYTRKPDDKKPPCSQCNELGYFGRTGIFEVLIVGENTRQALQTTPQLDAVRAAARKDGMRTLQEEGILLVAKGVTSLDELMRVLKG